MKRCIALFLLLFANVSSAQIYAFHSEIQGIFWNPKLTGWGFSFDVQKGILFGAIYGYDNAGDATFYTLISNKADGNAGLDFDGAVFQTNENGTATTQVGSFELSFGRNSGQPALAIDLDSPSLQLDDFLLIRFSYNEADELGLLSGSEVRTWFGTAGDGTDQNGVAWSFANARQLVDGTNTIDVVDASGTAGFAFFSEAGTYAVFFPQSGGQTLAFDFDLLNGRGGQGIAFTFDGNGQTVVPAVTMASAIVQLDEASTKAGLVPLSVQQRRDIIADYNTFVAANPRDFKRR